MAFQKKIHSIGLDIFLSEQNMLKPTLTAARMLRSIPSLSLHTINFLKKITYSLNF